MTIYAEMLAATRAQREAQRYFAGIPGQGSVIADLVRQASNRRLMLEWLKRR